MPKPLPCRLILASASPRRRQILSDAGYAFDVADPGEVEDEVRAAPTPDALAEGKAAAKARHIARTLQGGARTLIVGVDTLVASGPDVIGKPLDRPDAIRILTRLSGTRHRVLSGFCLLPFPAGEPWMGCENTWVTMKRMSPGEIQAYVASGEADGKAGAYAIQETGDAYVENVEGSFLNVVGFPLETFERVLPRAFEKWGWR